jgi:hypothetical protein
MNQNTTHNLDTLVEELAAVLEAALEEAVPLAQQEETELRDLEEVTQGAMK